MHLFYFKKTEISGILMTPFYILEKDPKQWMSTNAYK